MSISWSPARRISASAPDGKGLVGQPSDAMIGHLDALYALAYLSSGDADGAEDVVIEAFKRICREPRAKSPGEPRIWRTLADHVHLANRHRAASPGSDPAPFHAAGLSLDQQEAIALLLVDWRDTEVACLLGISPGEVRSHFRAGLMTLQAMWFPMSPIETEWAGPGIDLT